MDFDDAVSTVTEVFVDIDIEDEDNAVNFENISSEEAAKIQMVIEKDKRLRRDERKRRKKLEDVIDEQIIEICLKNVDDGVKFCSNCGEKFKILFNSRRICNECQKGICNSCTYLLVNKNDKICYLCYLRALKELKTGKWFAMESKLNGRFRRSASVVIMNSMRKNKKTNVPTQTIPNLNPEVIAENIGNGSIGVQPKNIYIPRVTSSMKPELVKEAEEFQRNVIKPAIDVTDAPEIKIDHVQIETIGSLNRLTSGVPRHLGSNLIASKALSISSASIYSETQESYKSGIPVTGEVSFDVYYDDDKKTLNVYIDECKNISVADKSKGSSNPYMKTYLLPDRTKTSKKKSVCRKHTVNPTFKETLSYNVPKESLSSRTLSVAVWHKRSMTYNIFLGEVHILLSDMDLTKKVPSWYSLHERMKYPSRSGGHIYKGELIIQLKYKPSTRRDGEGSLYVLVVEAQQLEMDGIPVNAYVKGHLLPDRTNKTKRKTSYQKGLNNVKWNSLLQFNDVSLADLNDRSLELCVYHHRKLKSNEFLGGVRLNRGLGLHSSEHVSWMDAQGAEKAAWETFLSSPNEYTEAILNLRPNLEY